MVTPKRQILFTTKPDISQIVMARQGHNKTNSATTIYLLIISQNSDNVF